MSLSKNYLWAIKTIFFFVEQVTREKLKNNAFWFDTIKIFQISENTNQFGVK